MRSTCREEAAVGLAAAPQPEVEGQRRAGTGTPRQRRSAVGREE